MSNVFTFPEMKDHPAPLVARSGLLIRALDTVLDRMIQARGLTWAQVAIDNAWARAVERTME